MAIQEISDSKVLDDVSGGLNGWGFTSAVLAIGAGMVAVVTAPAWGAIGGLLAIGAVGANAMSSYSSGGGSGGGGARPTDAANIF